MAKIIIVEDELIISENLRLDLEDLGHTVLEQFTNGKALINYLQNTQNIQPDLVLLDINIEGKLSGIDTAEIISISYEIPYIYLTANADKATFEKAKRTNPYGFLVKPYEKANLSTTVDLTLFKSQSDKKLKEMKHQLEIQKRFADLGESVGGLCHDLVSPLGVILERCHMLLNALETKNGQDYSKERIIEKLNKIKEVAEHSLNIVKESKSWLSEQPSETKEAINAHELIKESCALTRIKTNAYQVEIKIHKDLKEKKIYCEKIKTMQIIMNLINNALDAICDLEEKWIDISFDENDKTFTLIFTDSGSGIPTEIREKIFDPLFTTKSLKSGTGLGLSISRKMMVAQDGFLEIDENSANTCFKIHFKKNES